MGKKTLYHGAYVRANVDRPFRRDLSAHDWLSAAKDLEREIKRHCDGVESTSLELDSEDVCEFCGYIWAEEGDLSNECCKRDIAEAEAESEIKLTQSTDKERAALSAVILPGQALETGEKS